MTWADVSQPESEIYCQIWQNGLTKRGFETFFYKPTSSGEAPLFPARRLNNDSNVIQIYPPALKRIGHANY